ncbi:MAG: TaqI-like C-terminal specificity domain-containing protein [Candidatus Nanoarchaeia archaeon]|nr:TaqI-like C-terminal specificity domain-containing protein [Candidatus Nanoarchaeia archaeon]MDD5588139.1 TaqI-like C-terminal specificity domain-containing protein [Candidatus Nanoarchaeia archaeon]
MTSFKSSLGQVFTPEPIADLMVNFIDKDKECSILEPSAGQGVFIKKLKEKGFNNIESFEIDSALCKGELGIKCEDFLRINTLKKYSIIIGNPPYIRPHNISIKEKKFLWKSYKTASNKTDIYAYFFEKGISLLKYGGKLIFITSNTYFSLESFKKLRKLILDNCCIESIISRIPPKTFNAAVNTSIIILTREKDFNKRKENMIKYFEITDTDKLSFKLIREIPQQVFLNDKNYAFTISWDKEYSDIIDKINKNTKQMGELLEIRNGLATGDDIKFIKNKKESSIDKPVVYGKDIKRYSLDYKHKYVHYNPNKMLENRKTARPASKNWFETNEKIIIHQVGGSNIKGYLDTDKYYATISTILIKKNKNTPFDLRYVLGILNSSLIRYWYKKQSVTSTVKLSEIRRIPIFNIDLNNKLEKYIYTQIIRYVNKIQTLKKMNKIKDKTDEYDKKIDNLVFNLYNLNKQERNCILNLK